MPVPTDIQCQVDFSGGQINSSSLRRDDLPVVQTGALTFLNFRTEAQGTALSRPGRDALYMGTYRTEFVRMSASATFHVSFPPGQILITDTLGNVVFTSTSASYLWTNATVSQVSIAVLQYTVMVCFPGMQPEVLSWLPPSGGWSAAPFAWSVIAGNYQEPFFRTNALGASMSWPNTTGAFQTVGSPLVLTCSENYFTNAMIGNRLSILGGQVQITAVGSSTPIQTATVTVLSSLPVAIALTVGTILPFAIGDIVGTVSTGLELEVYGVGGSSIQTVLMNQRTVANLATVASDIVYSVNGNATISGAAYINSTVTTTLQWSEEFMSAYAGWPGAVSEGNDRLIFCQFPQRQEAILWTTVGQAQQCYIDSIAAINNQSAGANATSGILEFVDGRPKVLNVVDTGDEFVFTDHGVWFIPLAVAGIALKPGSVAFRQITNDGCSPVRPVPILQTVIYANAAGNRISVVRATGSYTLPYSSDDLTDVHSSLFNSPRCIAVSAGDASPERLVYVVNGDMTLTIGKFSRQTGVVGWHPEQSIAPTSWVSADVQNVWYNSIYPGGAIVELENLNDYCDGNVSYNSPPANMANGLLGPLWHLANGTAQLSDQGVDMGTRTVSATGFLNLLPGEVLSAYVNPQTGAPVTKTFTPIIRNAPAGQSRGQRMKRRSIKNALIKVQANCEFDWGSRRYWTYNFGDDNTQPANFNDINTVRTTPIGHFYDPTITLTSAGYGQLRILEFSAEVTV